MQWNRGIYRNQQGWIVHLPRLNLKSRHHTLPTRRTHTPSSRPFALPLYPTCFPCPAVNNNMPNADGSPLEWIAKIPLFGWMRPKPRDDHGHSDVPVEFCGLDMNAQANKPREPPKQQRSSPPKLCTKEESVLQTAPVSTCESSAASWSEMAVGSSDSSEMVTFHRLSQGVDSGPRRSPPPLTLTVDPEPAPAPTAPPVDIPWRLIDPDSATNPMQEVRACASLARGRIVWCTSEEFRVYI